MKVPISWLREYVALDAAPEEIAERLTFSGVEVEGIVRVGDRYTHVVAGLIRAVEPHPRADRLSVCTVFDGTRERRVVCGAPNAAAGRIAPLALSGAVLPNGMRVAETAIRGVTSEGMLCAEDELGLSDDHSALLALPADTRPGTPFVEIAGEPETVLDLEITWNRPDCLCILGIARELAALYGLPLRRPEVTLSETGEGVETLVEVAIEDPQGCPRYTARVLSGARLGPSPAWMQRRLTLCGVRAINNIVDITNYVMLECGQPLHAFDYTLLRGGRILVRRARAGERMATLDGVARAIDPEMLVIADADRPIALAGIMGGAGSEIVDTTETVLLESACFDPRLIHRTSGTLGLNTESSHRYERGVDVGGAEWASRRAAALMVDLAGATAARGVIDAYSRPPRPRRVPCRFDRLKRLLGAPVDPDTAVSILDRLELNVTARDAAGCTVEPPSFRPDIAIEADVIEEIVRMVGLDHVPAARPRACVAPGAGDAPTRAESACRGVLTGLGLQEVMHYSFVSRKLLEMFDHGAAARWVALPNPVSADQGYLREALLPQVVETLGRNLAHQTERMACFEMGRVFRRDAAGGIAEHSALAIGLMGPVNRGGLDARRPVASQEMFLWVKGVCEALFRAMHVDDVALREIDDARLDPAWRRELVLNGRPAGVIGLVAEAIRTEWRMAHPVGVAEVELAAVTAHVFRLPELAPLPAYPAVTRDIALLAPEHVTHEAIVRVIHEAAPPELTAVELFDIFRGKGVGDGRKSMAYSLVFRSPERTLTDADANRYRGAVRDALTRRMDVEVRET
jgi:phenylalanyl-tRNA synthetase beta chain